ncbi:hypothetical protein K491DRAFT_594416 [Lophiostoma macrostomum CBS 122681]|uniref:CENP-V/GFA domain-containing protein n=1 Tax=Lophiostoma macrostomum CBS 122681 TaxID=1314788 RepID=A0A6A6TER5_9PLEO|nr:hypothetical protein K491DRAFT_594416 [Lophiostoma macrostomum CBS 122681]
MSSETRTFTAHCLCKSSTLSFTIPTTSQPLPTHFCHCSICRRTHGTLAAIHSPIPVPETARPLLDTMTAYASSERVVRYFCSICGAHMLDKSRASDVEGEGEGEGWIWNVATSLVDAEEGVWQFTQHINVGSTVDGGLATWLPEIKSSKLATWNGNEGNETQHPSGDWVAPARSSPGPSSGEDTSEVQTLHAHCHCNGISFSIQRPRSTRVFENMPSSLTPNDKTKWYASNCVCTSCRLCSSSAIFSWAFPSIDHITLSDGSAYPPTHVFGTIKKYCSSPGVTRTFCGKCGAVVAYACDERPGMVDVAVGLLDAEEGVRAEGWLEWRVGRCGFEEDCGWEGVLGGLKMGMRGWAERDGG